MYLQKVLNLKDLQAFFTALSRRSETAVFMVYLYLMMSLFLLDLQSLKEPFHLLERDLFYFFRRSGPLEFHIIQKFLSRQDKPILIIPEDFYRISFPVTEDEDTVPIIRIQFKAECNSCNQSRDLLAKIRSSTLSEYLDKWDLRISVVGSMDWQRSYAFSLSLILTTKIHCFFSVEEDVTGSKHCSGKAMVFSLCTRDSIMVHSGGPVRQMRQWRSQTTSTVC